jgi:hypothetical protein
MTTFLLILAAWTLLAFIAGAIFGAGIRMADEHEQPDAVPVVAGREPRTWSA